MRRPALCLAAGLASLCLAAAAFADPVSATAGAAARLTRALAAAEAARGRASVSLLPILDQLATLRRRTGELTEAAALQRRAFHIAIARFGSDSANAAAVMTALGLVEIDRRNYLDAEPLLIAAGNILQRPGFPEPPALAAVWAGLARIDLARGEPAQGEARAERAVAIARRAAPLHRKNDRSAEALRALGAALVAEKRYPEAEQILAEALAQDRKVRGPDSSETARSLMQLADLDMHEKRFAEALPLIEEATAIDQAGLGPTHPSIADDLTDLGRCYEQLERPEDARRAWFSALDLLQRGAGRDTPRVAYIELDLGRIDRRQGKDAEAEAAFKAARHILNKAEAEEHRRERRA